MSFVSFDVDLDWEFDAPQWYDFDKEDTAADDSWFDEIERAEEKVEKNENHEESKESETKKVVSPEKRSRIPVYSRKNIKSCSLNKESVTNSLKQFTHPSQSRIPVHSRIPIMRSSSKNFLLH